MRTTYPFFHITLVDSYFFIGKNVHVYIIIHILYSTQFSINFKLLIFKLQRSIHTDYSLVLENTIRYQANIL